ncbi:MOSC domain-containing protein [Glaciecola siphonariae]|uniref:MOSC domain-containing protein n=1 Tax=Glaciecola siphonariae TaxID=521012 RepID=A0ABV9M112_9ALTE
MNALNMNISALFAGKPQPFGPRKSPSSIIKTAHESLNVVSDGATEDEQGNKKLHGGPQMALHQFAQASYIALQNAFPKTAYLMSIGSIGENISAAHMHEDNVFIGDIYQMGEVVVQVSSPRAPCSKINQRYGQKKIDLFILEHGITGWYFRVLQSGVLKVGDSIELTHRNEQPVSVKTLMHMSKPPEGISFSEGELQAALTTEGLAPEWQDKLQRRISALTRG